MNAWTITLASSLTLLLWGAIDFKMMSNRRAAYFASDEVRVDQALGVAPPPFPMFHSILAMATSVILLVILFVSHFIYS